MKDHSNSLTWDDFEKVEMRVGTILEATPFEKAKKPAYQLKIDFGPLGIKKSSAQITQHYQPNDLIGKQIIAVVNFPPKQIANFFSECLVLGIYQQGGAVVLLQPERSVENGDKIG
jgi:tRNA-binding protein